MIVVLSGYGMSASETMLKGDDGPNTFNYDCRGIPLVVIVNQELAQIRILVDGQVNVLPQAMSASGTKYDNGQYMFWSKGDKAGVYWDGTLILDDCQLKD